jgi:ubiquitin carboxyl-terminal hydrolase L5
MSWCTIESDPGVFNEMMESFGARNVACEEIYSLDMIPRDTESYGLIFLFKWVQENDPRPTIDPSEMPNCVFSTQTVQNACATQAILSVLLNIPEGKVELGNELKDFRSFVVDLDAESRGYAIGNSDSLRLVHNSFARAEPLFMEESKNARGKKEDAYHFVAYVPFQGKVYE